MFTRTAVAWPQQRKTVLRDFDRHPMSMHHEPMVKTIVVAAARDHTCSNAPALGSGLRCAWRKGEEPAGASTG